MNDSKYLLLAGLIAGSLGFTGHVQAGPYSWEPDPPPPEVCPPNQYGVSPAMWHSPQPLVRHGIASTLRATPHFATDRSNIDGAAQAELDSLLSRVHGLNSDYGLGKAGVAQSVSVVGHTDSRGSRRYNQDLSERRAQNTASYLAVQGVQREVIGISGDGETQPIASNRTRAGRAQNRRAEVTVNALIAP